MAMKVWPYYKDRQVDEWRSTVCLVLEDGSDGLNFTEADIPGNGVNRGMYWDDSYLLKE